jgi:hypothetical protein
MAGLLYLNLSEDMEMQLIAEYKRLCEELSEQLQAMAMDLEKLCEMTHWELLVNMVNSTKQMFDCDIHSASKQAFYEWIDGGGSFRAFAKNVKADDEVVEAAISLESKVKNLFDDFWLSKPMGEILDIDTSCPKVREDDIKELNLIYEYHLKKIKNISEDAINRITYIGGKNPTFNIIIPAIKALTELVKNAFEQFYESNKL